MPGVFAAGDVRHGSVKRVASGVGEGSMAIAFVHQYLGDRPVRACTTVIPAKAGSNSSHSCERKTRSPACAGATTIYTSFTFFSGRLRTGFPVAA